jgi:hypothetical protein
MKWLKIIQVVIECVIPILGHLGKKKTVKTLRAVTEGVERYSRVQDNALLGKELKNMIKQTTTQAGVEPQLNKLIKQWEEEE